MSAVEVLPTLARSRVIAILRGDFGGREEEIAAAILDGGITAIEVTLNSPNALDSIRRLAQQFGSRMAVGAGTVLKPEEVEAAAEAGARFMVSPNVKRTVIQNSIRLGLVSLPGCFTPTDILEALEAGAPAVKLFPANCLGPDFVRAIRGPLPEVRLVPTGGVTPDSARLYRAAGAWAVGIGSELLGKGEPSTERLKQIATRAREFVQAMILP